MSVVRGEVRPGVYRDSIALMQLQVALAELPQVLDAGAVMGTPENLATLEASGLLPDVLSAARPGDLVLVVRASGEDAACAALGQVDALLARTGGEAGDDFRPRSLGSACAALPGAAWVLLSVPGRFAAGVAREALGLGRNVFLYSDNVSVEEEASLKQAAREKGLLVMGPDCGTAVVGGIGLGFANRVRPGTIGLVGASGTGLQAIMSRVDERGAGISQAIGTGGRDLGAEIGGVTALQGLDVLARDPDTRVAVVVSKPPAAEVATRLLAEAGSVGKPVVVCFLGYAPPARRIGGVHFATGLAEAADLAVELAGEAEGAAPTPAGRSEEPPLAPCLRGLFSGGTLALETLQALRGFVAPLHSNVAMAGIRPLADPGHCEAHTILDLGADELTVGRPHPMIDNDLRLRRLRQEAEDPEVGIILLDVVLGDGAHPDPAAELAPAIAAALEPRGDLEIAALVVGTEADPQDLGAQIERLERAGAGVFRSSAEMADHVSRRLSRPDTDPRAPPVPLDAFRAPIQAINVGLESFHDSLVAQGCAAVHVDWRPPAGGDEKLMAILEKMRR
ncbi:MAG: acyl-CoA synthetase FdrA [Gemmatimonadota bacterium]